MILGLLAQHGAMHGHQLRRTGELTNVQAWGGITGGAIYRELHRLEDEGLIAPVRREQVGRRPARTVYEVTGEGRLELVVQREAAITSLYDSADPMAVVLLFAAGDDPGELLARLVERRHRITGERDALASERVRLTSQGVLDDAAIAAFRRGELRLEAELAWHAEFERQHPWRRQPPGLRPASGADGSTAEPGSLSPATPLPSSDAGGSR